MQYPTKAWKIYLKTNEVHCWDIDLLEVLVPGVACKSGLCLIKTLFKTKKIKTTSIKVTVGADLCILKKVNC